MKKIIVILGPTSSGKSDLAVKIAEKFNGEVISADSRQVYKGLNLGTGKVTKTEMKGVKHYLLDIVSPKKQYSVFEYQKETFKVIEKIINRNKISIICGGTGLYIKSIVDNLDFPEIKADKKLREKLEKKSEKELLNMLKKLDSKKAKNIDTKNKRRLIRAIEIIKTQINADHTQTNAEKNKYKFLQIGLKVENKLLRKRISERLIFRTKKGLIKEVKNLHEKGLSWKRMEELGLEYRYVSRYLRKNISKEEMLEQLENKIWQYSRRQMTWFRKDKRIKWFEFGKYNELEKEVKKFLKK